MVLAWVIGNDDIALSKTPKRVLGDVVLQTAICVREVTAPAHLYYPRKHIQQGGMMARLLAILGLAFYGFWTPALQASTTSPNINIDPTTGFFFLTHADGSVEIEVHLLTAISGRTKT